MISPLSATRLRKAATDNGFDLEIAATQSWLGFQSSHVRLVVWLTESDDGGALVGLSQLSVALELGGEQSDVVAPLNSSMVLRVANLDALYALLRRAFQLSRALPDQPLNEFKQRTALLPRSTETERLVVQRIGQDIYRQGLIDYWDARCAVTGFDLVRLLRASHSKPWAACTSDAERLDIFNGFLLAPHVDALFDGGYVTFENDGNLTLAHDLSIEALAVLGLVLPLSLRHVTPAHRDYLAWHRKYVFRSTA